MEHKPEALLERISHQLAFIYRSIDAVTDYESLAKQLMRAFDLPCSDENGATISAPAPYTNHWTEKDVIVITYGDSLISAK